MSKRRPGGTDAAHGASEHERRWGWKRQGGRKEGCSDESNRESEPVRNDLQDPSLLAAAQMMMMVMMMMMMMTMRGRMRRMRRMRRVRSCWRRIGVLPTPTASARKSRVPSPRTSRNTCTCESCLSSPDRDTDRCGDVQNPRGIMLLAATQISHERAHALPDEPITAKLTEKFGWPSAGPDDAIHTVGFG